MRRAGWILAGALAALALMGGTRVLYQRQQARKAWNERSQGLVKDLLSQRKPAPVGRFLLDLPKGAKDLNWTQGYMGAGPLVRISEWPLWTKAKALAEAEAEKWKSKISESDVLPGSPLLEGFVESKRVPHTWIWFYWDDRSTARDKYDLARCEGYHWRNGRLFEFKRGAGHYRDWAVNQSKVLREMEDLFASLRVLKPGEVPTEPGFCMRDSILLGEPKGEDLSEDVSLSFTLPGHPDLNITFLTKSNDIHVEGPLLERYEEKRRKLESLGAGSTKELRKDLHRKAAGLEGQEILSLAANPWDGRHRYEFVWEAQGGVQDPYAPHIRLEMILNSRKPSLSGEALLTLWDGLLNSVKVRPVVRSAGAAFK